MIDAMNLSVEFTYGILELVLTANRLSSLKKVTHLQSGTKRLQSGCLFRRALVMSNLMVCETKSETTGQP